MHMKPTDVRGAERWVLDTLEILCRVLWRIASPEIRQEYLRFASEEGEVPVLDGQALPAGENAMFGFAFDIFAAVGLSYVWETADPDIWLQELSLFACRLGAEATRSDAAYHFRRRLAAEENVLAEYRVTAALSTPPDWVRGYVRDSMKRYRSFKKLGLSPLAESEARISGGDLPLTKRGREALYLERRVKLMEETVSNTASVILELERGNWSPALADLASNLSAAIELYEAALYHSINPRTGEMEYKKGVLTTFLRPEGEGVSLDREAVESNYHLYRVLLDVIQPTVGRA